MDFLSQQLPTIALVAVLVVSNSTEFDDGKMAAQAGRRLFRDRNVVEFPFELCFVPCFRNASGHNL